MKIHSLKRVILLAEILLTEALFLPNLREVQLHRRLAVEDEHHDGEFALVHVDRIHRAFVVLERTVHDDDQVSHLEVALELRLLLADATLDNAEFLRSDGDWDIAGAHETRDVRGVSDQVPGFETPRT